MKANITCSCSGIPKNQVQVRVGLEKSFFRCFKIIRDGRILLDV